MKERKRTARRAAGYGIVGVRQDNRRFQFFQYPDRKNHVVDVVHLFWFFFLVCKNSVVFFFFFVFSKSRIRAIAVDYRDDSPHAIVKVHNSVFKRVLLLIFCINSRCFAIHFQILKIKICI